MEKKTGEDPDTKEPIFEKYGNVKYNFSDKETFGDFSAVGKLLGRIEISFEVKVQAKVKDAKGSNVGDKDKMEKKGKIGFGAKAESYFSLAIPKN